jgi:hypothetical protein
MEGVHRSKNGACVVGSRRHVIVQQAMLCENCCVAGKTLQKHKDVIGETVPSAINRYRM